MPYTTAEVSTGTQVFFEAWGKTREELFSACAEALVDLMATPGCGGSGKVHTVLDIQEEDLETLLVEFLEEIIYYRNVYQLLLTPARVDIEWEGEDERYFLMARMRGQTIDPRAQGPMTNVKGVARHRVEIRALPDHWRVRTALDL